MEPRAARSRSAAACSTCWTRTPTPSAAVIARSAGAGLLRTDWFVSGSETDVLSSSWLHEARFQFARFDQQSRSLDPRCDGPCDLDDEGGPLVVLSGVATAGRNQSTPLARKQNRYQLSDTVSYFGGNHMLKAGVDFEATQTLQSTLPSYFGGAFIFTPLPGTALAAAGLPVRAAPLSALEAFEHGLPAAYIQGYGQPGISYTYKELSVFVQDEWRATPKLTLRAGLRYQRQFWPDHDYSIPNLGGTRLEYADAAGHATTSRRASGSPSTPAATGARPSTPATGCSTRTTSRPRAASPTSWTARDHVRVYSRVFPTSVTAWRAADHALPEQSGVPTVVALDPGLETPYSHQFSLGWDQAIGTDFAVNANLLYVRGFNQLGAIDYNPVLPDLGVRRRPNDVDGRAGTSGSLLQYTGYGENWYKGLTLALSKRFNRGSEFLLSYTLSKAEDTVDRLLQHARGLGARTQSARSLPDCPWASIRAGSADRRPTTSGTAWC